MGYKITGEAKDAGGGKGFHTIDADQYDRTISHAVSFNYYIGCISLLLSYSGLMSECPNVRFTIIRHD